VNLTLTTVEQRLINGIKIIEDALSMKIIPTEEGEGDSI
jgi:hypothetical protein